MTGDFGDCIFDLPQGRIAKHLRRLTSSSRRVFGLGLDLRTNEVIVFGPDGIARATTSKRKAIDDAYRKEDILKVDITPWDEKISSAEAKPIEQEPAPQLEIPLFLLRDECGSGRGTFRRLGARQGARDVELSSLTRVSISTVKYAGSA